MKHTNGNASVVAFVRDMNGVPKVLKQKRNLDAHLEALIKNSFRYEAVTDGQRTRSMSRREELSEPHHEIHWNMKIREDGELDYEIGIRSVKDGKRQALIPELRQVPHHVLKRYVEILGGLIAWLQHDGEALPGKSDNDYPWPADRQS